MTLRDVILEAGRQRRMKAMGWNDRHTDPEQWCIDCGKFIYSYEDPYEDARGNPICEKCHEKKIDGAEARHESDR